MYGVDVAGETEDGVGTRRGICDMSCVGVCTCCVMFEHVCVVACHVCTHRYTLYATMRCDNAVICRFVYDDASYAARHHMHISQVLADTSIRREYARMHGMDLPDDTTTTTTTASHITRRTLDGTDCGICCEGLSESEEKETVWCQYGCGE